MQKLSMPLRVAAYSASIFLSCICFGSVLFFSAPDGIQTVKPLPLLKLNTITPVDSIIKERTPFMGFEVWQRPKLKQPGARTTIPVQITTVLGVLPPDVAIIREGNKTSTIKLGQTTQTGTLTEVTEYGAVIGGKKYKIFQGGK